VHNGPIPEVPKDDRIHVFMQQHTSVDKEKDMNVCANEAIDKTLGEFCCRLDHDNLLEPTAIEDRLKFMKANPKITLCYTEHTTIDETGHRIPNRFEAVDYDEKILVDHNFIDGNAVMIRGEILRKYKFDINEWVEDWGLWLRLVNDGHVIKKLSTNTYRYRAHRGQKTRLDTPDIVKSANATREYARTVKTRRGGKK